MFGFEKFLIIGVLLIVFLFAVLIVDEAFFNVPASEKALNSCIERGFDYADHYTRVPFTVEPKGIKCKYAYNIETKGDSE